MKSEEASSRATGSAETKPCPSSPSPDSFEIPKVESEKYYEKLSPSIVEPLKDELDAKIAEAGEQKEASFAQADEKKQAAQDAYEAADRKSKSDQRILDIQIKNKKTKIHSDYRKSLREALPKNYVAPGDRDIEKDAKVPDEQKAVKIAELRQKLATEELGYLATVQEIQRNWSVAGNNWKLAQEQYESDRCTAKATEEKAKLAAIFDWRTAISKALEDANK